MSVSQAPAQAEDAEEKGEDQSGMGLDLGGADRQGHQSAAEQAGPIAAIVGKERWQGVRLDRFTLAQGGSAMKKPRRWAGLGQAPSVGRLQPRPIWLRMP